MLNYSMNFQHYFFYHLLWFKKIVLVYRWVLAMFALSKYDNQQIKKKKTNKEKKKCNIHIQFLQNKQVTLNNGLISM